MGGKDEENFWCHDEVCVCVCVCVCSIEYFSSCYDCYEAVVNVVNNKIKKAHAGAG